MPDYREEVSSQIPALQLLLSLGYTYLTPDEALTLRGGKTSSVLLESVLSDWLQANNQAIYKGQSYPLAESNIQTAVAQLRDEPFDGLISTNARVYDLLTLGTSLPQTIDGDRRSYTINYINWKQPEKNVYHVTDEFIVEIPGSRETCRPDIVCFVNGIPLVVIECKRPDLNSGAEKPTDEAISQMVRNQGTGYIPNLFVYSQLLLAISKNDAFFATTGTKKKFWSLWREEDDNGNLIDDVTFDKVVSPFINRSLSELEKQHLYDHRPFTARIRREFDQIAANGGRLPTVQDRTLYNLLNPQRLLELIYQFIVYDGGKKKIARYQQYFAVKATIARVAHLNHQHQRTGGVIWHTTGSGKSLTMVMLAKALALHPNIANPKVVIVTDRINLDEQIWSTFVSCGKNVVRAKHGGHLVKQIRSGRADIITTVINKFDTAVRRDVQDDNINIFVLVDESHRSQYGEFHVKMRRVFPKACYIGFTGTPLLKKEKGTAEKFGGFIHKYPMRRAVEDEAVVPLLYEGRIVDMEVDQKQIDRWFERVTRGLSDEQKVDLKRKFSSNEIVNRAEQRVYEVAFDIAHHYKQHWKRSGFKAQLATPSKALALKYKQFLDEWGGLETAVLISPPDMREGYEEVDDLNEPLLQAFWKKMMQQYGSEENYNKEIKGSFAREDGIEILIVVDKLLTGFDEPRNRILYVDKPLKEHGLLQAIARVNRLFDGKDEGFIIDYRGVLGELNKALQTYNALEAFDAEDVAGTLTDIEAEIDKLPDYHNALWDIFKTVPNKQDSEQMERFLEPEDIRQSFYQALNNFAHALKIALASVSFYETTPEATIERYKRDLKQFHNLRTAVRQRYAEAIDYKEYEQKVRHLVDTHLQAEGVSVLTQLVNIFDVEAFDAEVARVEGSAAKADTIAYRMKRTITENMDKDPAFFRRFSQMIEETIAAYRAGRIDEIEFLTQMQQRMSEMRQGHVNELPQRLTRFRDAPAYFGIIKESLAAYKLNETTAVDAAIQLEAIIEARKIRDWKDNPDVKNRIHDDIEDYLYELSENSNFTLTTVDIDEIIESVISVARHRDGIL